MPAAERAGSRHFDAAALAKVAGLQLRVRQVVDGAMAGLHRAPYRGASVEFAEHKEYSPGDDLRRLDWKAYGKFDRYYIRQYEEETELSAYILLDCSGSMGYGEPLSKLSYGSVLAGSLSFLLGRQRDQAGLLAFADEVRQYVPPRSRANHQAALLTTLESLEASGRTSLGRALTRLLEVVHRRSLIVLISDLFDEDEAALKLLTQLRARRHQVVVLQLLHADELDFPFQHVSLFASMEDERELLADPRAIRRTYLRELEAFCARVETTCRQAELRYHRVSTADALDQVLLRLLERRL